jgi:hypothetical protein
MFSRWIVTNITSASVTTFLAFLAGIISWSVYRTTSVRSGLRQFRRKMFRDTRGSDKRRNVPAAVWQQVRAPAQLTEGADPICTECCEQTHSRM